LAAFQKAMSEAAVKLFGSGWAWLAADPAGKLEIMPLGNADTPLKHDKEPVLTIDVWEHAYYIDFRNERPKYVEAFWKAANWNFAGKCYAAAVK
jgi:Fe-Mn family superoxide dismutase